MSGIVTEPAAASPAPFAITGLGIDAVGADGGAIVGFAGEGDARMFRRRAIRLGGGQPERIEMLVAELNGVRAYMERAVDGRFNVVLSRLDIAP